MIENENEKLVPQAVKKINFCRAIKRTADIYRVTFSDGMYDSYWKGLKDFELSDIEVVLIKLSIECKFMPKPYDISQAVKKLIEDRKEEGRKNNPHVEKKMTEEEYLDFQSKRWGYDARTHCKKHEDERKRLTLTPQQYCVYLVKHSSFGNKYLSQLGK